MDVSSRVNTLTWVDCRVLTKFSGNLQAELVEWLAHGEGRLGGDRGVLVAAIELRNKLNAVIEKSREANVDR